MVRNKLVAALAANVCLMSACVDDPSSGGDRPTPDQDPSVFVAPRTERTVRGGRVHAVPLANGVVASSLGAADLLPALQRDLAPQLGNLSAADFTLVDRATTAAGRGARLHHIHMKQAIGGVPVEGTYLQITVRQAAGEPSRIVASSFNLIRGAQVDTHASITVDRAIAMAAKALRLRSTAAVTSQKLVIKELDRALQLTWAISLQGSHERAFVIASGPRLGRVVTVDERVYETDGNVGGWYVTGGAGGLSGVLTNAGLGSLNVTAPGGSAQTDGAGNFFLDVPAGQTITATLSGTASQVNDFSDPNLVASGPAAPTLALQLGSASSSINALAQVTAYVFATREYDFLIANGVPAGVLGAPLTTNVNLDSTCNAFYDPFERSINFFHAGDGCGNTATDSIASHEYGHFADDMMGGIIDGGLSEGWGDLMSCYILGFPEVGIDLFPGQVLRSCQNDYVYPPGGGDEAHNLGQAWAGFGWDVRQGLIAQLGDVDGEALARALVVPALLANTPDIPASVRDVFLRDDDDGDLTNQTPHWDVLMAAAEHHGLGFAVEADVTPPAQIQDLQVFGANATTVTLAWTAPGDDDFIGTAAFYDIRWSTQPITADNFFAATPVTTGTPAPFPGGFFQTATVGPVPPLSTVFFAMTATDEQFNTSLVSNSAQATTTGTVVYQDGAENGLGEWTATGLWHITELAASEGTHSYWYGQESTGNYDTGDTNSGTLTSPVIDLTGVSGAALVIDRLVDVEGGDFFDHTDITVTNLTDPSQSVVFPKDTAFTGGVFQPGVYSLEAFAGAQIQITFSFDTVDALFNSTIGWLVDNIRVVGDEGGGSCSHPVCVVGDPLDPSCSSCAATVCAVDSFCCEVFWDEICVAEAEQMCDGACNDTCGNGVCDPGETPESCPGDCAVACEHDECEPGLPLPPDCSSCVADVCAADDFCCTQYWDRLCVQEAETMCGLVCEGCAHDECQMGAALEAGCDTCTDTVCAVDAYCCTTAWDSRCIAESNDMCGNQCEECLHSVCTVGENLSPSCDPCVQAVCAADDYCCTNTWDQRCIDDANEICGIPCLTLR